MLEAKATSFRVGKVTMFLVNQAGSPTQAAPQTPQDTSSLAHALAEGRARLSRSGQVPGPVLLPHQ